MTTKKKILLITPENREIKNFPVAKRHLGIEGVTVSILTPLPKTPLYARLQAAGRLLTEDWSYYNGKTRVAFQPKNMTPAELFAGYMEGDGKNGQCAESNQYNGCL